MFKQELAQIWRPLAARLLLVGLVPCLFFIFKKKGTETEELFLIALNVLSVVTLWIANYLGVTAFKNEHNDRAFEYLLTMPCSRLKLVMYKLAPRMLVLALLWSVFIIGYVHWYVGLLRPIFLPDPLFLLDPVVVISLTLAIFCLSFSLSIFSWKNTRLVIGIPGIIVWALCYRFIAKCMHPERFSALLQRRISASAATVIVVLIAGLAFWRMFRKFDMHVEAFHLRRFLYCAAPPLALLTIMFFATHAWRVV